ncbi:MAG: cell division protein FtsW [Patescibacteria group bacterium]|nr:putative lipid II flippase FtsW [Patescibacteria group bacterium]MDE1943947.1 cell division protein FtsW [Patescibacteria group bacterium]MDE1945020.1 cell division protein FtsW [Patescibacteria group bacterium]MDE2057526.1 cell division protein FtsW [Patescibacteria group bacterium]
MKRLAADKTFFALVATASLSGLAIFSSATLGLLARENPGISHDILLQAGLGLGGGFVALAIAALVPLPMIKKYAPYLYAATLLLTALVFIPGVGLRANGATRWINIGFTTMQPGEFLKIGFVLAWAAWLAPKARQLADFKKGLVPFLAYLAPAVGLLLLEPNTSTTMLVVATGAVMYFAAGAPWRDFGILIACVVLGLGAVVALRPYVLQRFETFIHPSANSLGSGYQIQQSLIAVGSGGITGRGFGESVAKFNYLPEPDGDSIFAVFAEETGFIGAVLLLALFVGIAARGIVIAGNARELYGGLVALGISFLIIFQAFINISAMLGIIPLTGLPLPFVSHGGTALLALLLSCGLVLNVAREGRRG